MLASLNIGRGMTAVVVALLFTSCSGAGEKRLGTAATSGRYSHTLHSRFYEAWVQPKIVGAPRGTVLARVHRARKVLARTLADQWEEATGEA